MNVYDFDNTIFVPDSSYCFIRFCMRHYPRAVLHVVPSSLRQLVIYLREGRKDAQKLKEALFSFLNRIDDVSRVVEEFWAENFDRIEAWYLEQKRPDDLVISASPEFLLKPATDRLGIRLIATPMDSYTGRITGKNCHDWEKKRRFHEEYPGEEIDDFYSDSLTDAPLAQLARTAWLVKDHQCIPWNMS